MKPGLATGTIRIIFAQAVFLLSGMIIQFSLGRILGPSDYGSFSVVISLMNICYMIITSGIPLAASREIAANEQCTEHIYKLSLKLQTIITAIVLIAYYLLAYPLAILLGDASLVSYIELSAIIVPFYGYYALYTNFHNGALNFGQQSNAMLALSITKVLGVFGLVFLGYSVGGAVMGYLIAALCGFFVAFKSWKPAKTSFDCVNPQAKDLWSYAIPITAYSVIMTLMMSIDLLALKSLLVDDTLPGLYASAITIAKLPYLILIALSFTLFPAIAKHVAAHDMTQVTNHISKFIRTLIIVLIPLTSLLFLGADRFLTLIYTTEFSDAAAPLQILSISYAFLTVFSILISVVQASGAPRIALSLVFPLVPLILLLNLYLIPTYGMMGGAFASLITFLVGMVLSVLYITYRFGKFIPGKTLVRVTVSATIVLFLGSFVTIEGIGFLLTCLLLLGVYGLLLILLREITSEDFHLIWSSLRTLIIRSNS